MSSASFQELLDVWLARAESPASGMEAELQSAREKIKELEHNIREGKRISEVKEQEKNVRIEMLEKVIMAMGSEIKSLNEGHKPQLSMGKPRAIEEAQEKLMKAEKEKEELKEKLVEVIESRNTQMKVVESVSNNVVIKKNKKLKDKVPCRNYKKPDGCSWGSKCKFLHGEDPRLGKDQDCADWMDGECRFPAEVCWNKHDPAKKGVKARESQPSQSDFQVGMEQQGLAPRQVQAAGGMDGEEWMTASSRKKKGRMKEKMSQQKEQELQKKREGLAAPTCPMDGESSPMNILFPQAGEQNQQILISVLQTLMRQAGVSM